MHRLSPLALLLASLTIAGCGVVAEQDTQASPAPSTTVATTTAPPSTTAPPTTPSTTTPSTTTPSTTTAPTTTAPTTTAPTTTEPPAPVSLRQGSEGPEVQELQQALVDLGFWMPAVDGRYGAMTAQAVMAFQKSQDLGRDGIAGPATRGAIETAVAPTPRYPERDGFELDIARQLLLRVSSGGVTHVFNTSTGRPGWETRPGDFAVFREIDGVRHAPLGDLYRPKYFDGGIAVHGSPSIPGSAASHGCARVHDDVMDLIWTAGLAPIGTAVSVY